MRSKPLILKTKLVSPRLKSTILRRQKIIKKMRMIADYPLTIVHSGPGYGKSTAVSSYFRDESAAVCWYTVSPEDTLIPYVQYIIHSVRAHIPSFAIDIETDFINRENIVKEETIYLLCTELINEFLRYQEEIVLVIDDFHLIENSEGIQQWMSWFIQHLPNTIRLVMISRTKPKWDILTAMKVRGTLLEITEVDLTFSAEEIEVLFTDYYEYPLQPDDIIQIIQKTEGWVIAIQMVWQRLSNGEPLSKILDNQATTMEDLFRFLAAEVLSKQTQRLQQFLLGTSLLDELNRSVCNFVLEIEDSDEVLEKIADLNLFVSHIGETQFRYHALFKDFLLSYLKKDSASYERLQQRAARYYLSKKREEQAIAHYKGIGATGEIANILNDYGRTMIEQGKLERLLYFLSYLTESNKNDNYLLWIYEGDIHRYRSQYDRALACYKQGEKMAHTYGDSLGEAYGLEGQARVYLDTIQPGRADQLLKAAVNIIDSLPEVSNHNKVRLYSLMAENLINLGRAVEAEEWFIKCCQYDPRFQAKELEARLFLRTGRLSEVVKVLDLGKDTVRQDQSLPQAHRETDALLSIAYAFLGEANKAKHYAQGSIMHGIKLKAPFVEACGWMRMGHAAQLQPNYDFKTARECYETALEIMDSINVSRGKAEPLMGLCLLYGREKSLELAIKHGEMGLEETERVKDLWLSSLIRLCMGISYVYSAKWEEALDVFYHCEEGFTQCGDRYGIALLYLWKAYIFYETERIGQFKHSMAMLLGTAKAEKYDYLFIQRTAFSPRDIRRLVPLFLEAQKLGIESSYVSYILESIGLNNAVTHPGYTLRIRTLGQFQVWLGDSEVEEKDWQRGKAKELLQLFVTKRRMLIPKDQILAALWPDMDEEAANRDFKVALNALNRALEPQRTARANPYFLQKNGSSYGIHGTNDIELDVSHFEESIQRGLESDDLSEAEQLLMSGLQLYRGDYLPEARYEDKYVEERERLQVLFLRGAEKLSRLSLDQDKLDQTIYWCEQILSKDSCWEEAYRLLVMCNYRKRNRTQALRWLQKCRQSLQDELGIKPMPETEKLHDLIASL